MRSSAKRPSLFRLSLRELLAIVVFFGVACIALKFANEVWLSVIAFATLLIFLAAVITAIIDRGNRQAFAIGVVICCSVYGAMVMLSRSDSRYREFDPYDGNLPTTKVLLPLFKAIVWNRPTQDTGGMVSAGMSSAGVSSMMMMGNGFGTNLVAPQEVPDRYTFMTIAHLLWALLLGAVGGHFARFVYSRRVAEAPT